MQKFEVSVRVTYYDTIIIEAESLFDAQDRVENDDIDDALWDHGDPIIEVIR